jgi:DNA invertase Pin-like site-specific DNA recombinase
VPTADSPSAFDRGSTRDLPAKSLLSAYRRQRFHLRRLDALQHAQKAEQTSSVAQRDVLRACLDFVREGDVLMVTKPDRLARSTAELLTIEADLSKRGVGLIVLGMGGERLDTRNPTSKLMLTILAGVATWEREIMLERQREGIAKAKAEGRYKGRPPSIDADEVRRMKDAGIGPAAIAKQLKVARSSVYRALEVS